MGMATPVTDAILALFKEVHELDPRVLHNMNSVHVGCTGGLTAHPTVQCSDNPATTFLGLINGVCAKEGVVIALVYDDKDKHRPIGLTKLSYPSLEAVPEESEKNKSLTIAVKDDQLVISIGVNTLAHAANMCDDFYDDGYFTEVLDPDQFAQDMANQLNGQEDEDGSSILTRALDKYFMLVFEDGSESMKEYIEDVDQRRHDAPLIV